MKVTTKKILSGIIITLLIIAAIYYIVPFHGTRGKTVYDIDRETEVVDCSTLQLFTNQVVEQHFVADSYCLKGINYVLIGIDEEAVGECEFTVQNEKHKVLFHTTYPYRLIEPGQWQNIELPTHLQMGQEYILTICNLSEEIEPYILTGSKENISSAEENLIVQGETMEQGLYLSFGFREEFSDCGKVWLCAFCVLIWAYAMYGIFFRKREAERLWIEKHLPILCKQEGLQPNKKYYFDFLRVIAIWMVIYNHTVLNGFVLFTEERGTGIYWIEQFFSILIKVAVPLFWMMSGALLLAKEESLKTLFKKRILRFFIVLVSFTLIQYLYKLYFCNDALEGVENYFQWIYQYCDIFAYWYLYAYLGYLVMLPVLRKIAKGLQKVEFQYVFIVYTIYTGVLPMFEYFVLKEQYHLRSDFSIPVLSSTCIAFALLGYYMEHLKKEEEYTVKRFLLWLFLSFLSILVTALATKYRCEVNNKWSETFAQYFFNSFIIVPTYTTYYGVKLWSMHHDTLPFTKKVWSVMGGAAFGLMLIENIVREQMNFVFDFLTPHFGKFLGGMMWVTAIVIVGLVISAVLKKLPIIRKII